MINHNNLVPLDQGKNIPFEKYNDLSIVGSYNHFSHQIELNKYGVALKDDIERSLYITQDDKLNKKDFSILMNVHSLLWHEYTHFLDHSTTLWGLEFNIRTLNLYQAIQNNKDIDEKYEVFCLNLAEINLYHKIKKYERSTKTLKVGYRLEYDNKLGIYALYSLYDKDSSVQVNGIDMATPVCEIPLSMLAIIEANAYAQELLFKYNVIARYKINVSTEKKKLKLELEKYIADCEMSVYSIMIRHSLQVFPQLDFIKVLEIVSAIARFVLNVPILLFSAINHNYIYQVFSNTDRYTNILIHDFARGANRASLFLILIQLLSGTHAKSTEFNIREELNKIITAITNNLVDLTYAESMYKRELEYAIEFIQDIQYDSPLKKIGLYNVKNARMYENFEFDFNQIILPDFTIGDSTVLEMPKRLKFEYKPYLLSLEHEYNSLHYLMETGYKKRHNIAELGGNIFEDYKKKIVPDYIETLFNKESVMKSKPDFSKQTRQQRRKALRIKNKQKI